MVLLSWCALCRRRYFLQFYRDDHEQSSRKRTDVESLPYVPLFLGCTLLQLADSCGHHELASFLAQVGTVHGALSSTANPTHPASAVSALDASSTAAVSPSDAVMLCFDDSYEFEAFEETHEEAEAPSAVFTSTSPSSGFASPFHWVSLPTLSLLHP